MQPADIRIDPWVWIPFSRPRRRVLPTILVAAAAATAGYMMGRHSNRADVAPPQKIVAASPTTQPIAAKARDAGEKPDLALKSDGETKKPQAPPLVLLNPGTADSKGVLDRATTRPSRMAPARVGGEESLRSSTENSQPREERAAGSRNSMRDYRDLRDYMMRR
jgi:hypothetical protein